MNRARPPLVLLAVIIACCQPQSGRAADAADERIAAAIRTAQGWRGQFLKVLWLRLLRV